MGSQNISREANPLLFWRNDVLYKNLVITAQKYYSFQMSSVASLSVQSQWQVLFKQIYEIGRHPII